MKFAFDERVRLEDSKHFLDVERYNVEENVDILNKQIKSLYILMILLSFTIVIPYFIYQRIKELKEEVKEINEGFRQNLKKLTEEIN